MNDYLQEAKKCDVRFWTKMSNLDDLILMVKFQTGRGIKRQYKKLVEDEEMLANIEL